MITKLGLLATALTFGLSTLALDDEEVAPTPPAARSEDVATLDGLMAAVYDVISGDAGEERDWDRFRSLFHPELGRLMAVGPRREGGFGVRAMRPEDYVASAGAFFAQEGFYESELARRTERFGHIAHAFSTYESRRAPGDEPFARGINSFQMLWDGERWWVLSIFWDQETDELPIPEEYLSSPR